MPNDIDFGDVVWWFLSRPIASVWSFLVGGWAWSLFLLASFVFHTLFLVPPHRREALESYLKPPAIFFGCCKVAALLYTLVWGDGSPCPIFFWNANILVQRINRHGNATDFCVYLHDPDGKVKYDQGMKYVSVSHNIKDLTWRDRCSMPHLPAGDWNTADLGATGAGVGIRTTSCDPLLGVHADYQWSRDYVNFFDLKTIPTEWATNTTQLVDTTKAIPGIKKALLKFAGFREDIEAIERETEVYQYLDDYDIAPKFLGHVTDGTGRVVGLLLEYIEDGRALEKGMFSDLALELCRESLYDLHNLTITHGNADPQNCLIRRNGTTIWIDFGQAKRVTYGPNAAAAFDRDFKALDKGFRDLPPLQC